MKKTKFDESIAIPWGDLLRLLGRVVTRHRSEYRTAVSLQAFYRKLERYDVADSITGRIHADAVKAVSTAALANLIRTFLRYREIDYQLHDEIEFLEENRNSSRDSLAASSAGTRSADE